MRSGRDAGGCQMGRGGADVRHRGGEGRREKGRKRKQGTQDPASLDLKLPGWRREAEGPLVPPWRMVRPSS